MHLYLVGIVLIQLITLVIFWVNTDTAIVWNADALLRLALPLGLLAVVTALWFDAIGRGRANQRVAKMQQAHQREREKLHQRSEKEKEKVRVAAEKRVTRETRRVSVRANIKVALAFAAAVGAGLVMLITELITFGMMTLMTAGGALGGYLFRGRKSEPVLPAPGNGAQPVVIGEGSTQKATPDSDQSL